MDAVWLRVLPRFGKTPFWAFADWQDQYVVKCQIICKLRCSLDIGNKPRAKRATKRIVCNNGNNAATRKITKSNVLDNTLYSDGHCKVEV